jgi:hypothetical protein
MRRKIEAAAGIPPTILHFHTFWDSLEARVSQWVESTFGIEIGAQPDTRRVTTGPLAVAQLSGLLSIVFSGNLSPGICAVAIDDFGARLNAANRLSQGASELDGLSSLFQKLLFETPAAALWRDIAADYDDHIIMGSQAPIAEPEQVAGGFDAEHRYLVVRYRLPADGGEIGFLLIFNLDYLLRRAANDLQLQASRHRAVDPVSGRSVIRESVKHSMISVDGVLHRMGMTIGECSRIEVGQVIPLQDVDTARVTLRAETVNGTVDIGECEMGVWKQQRALKLNSPILEPFIRELAKI